MDAAVWIARSVVDGRRSDREAEAAAYRRARDARRARAAGDHRVPRRPWRTDVAVDAADVVGPLETVDDGQELVGAGRVSLSRRD
jgi:hypothetical protein